MVIGTISIPNFSISSRSLTFTLQKISGLVPIWPIRRCRMALTTLAARRKVSKPSLNFGSDSAQLVM